MTTTTKAAGKTVKKITTKKIKKTVVRRAAKKTAPQNEVQNISVIIQNVSSESEIVSRPVAAPEFKIKKPKMAIVSLTSCEGCQFAILDLGERFLSFTASVEMVDFRLIEDEEDSGTKLDLVLVEGNPVTEANVKLLQEVRKRSRVLAALGNCAAMGGIPEIKNYHEGVNTIKHVYKYIQGISNPEIKEIDNFVKVDFYFPGCPINGEEFLK